MIITLKKDAPKAEVEKLIHTFENKGLSVAPLRVIPRLWILQRK